MTIAIALMGLVLIGLALCVVWLPNKGNEGE